MTLIRQAEGSGEIIVCSNACREIDSSETSSQPETCRCITLWLLYVPMVADATWALSASRINV